MLREVLDGDKLLGMTTAEVYARIGKGPSVDDDPSVARLVVEAAVAHFIAKGNPTILANIIERIDGPSKAIEPEPQPEPLTCDDDALDIFRTLDRLAAPRGPRTAGVGRTAGLILSLHSSEGAVRNPARDRPAIFTVLSGREPAAVVKPRAEGLGSPASASRGGVELANRGRTMIERAVSGSQTGADQAGWRGQGGAPLRPAVGCQGAF